MNKLVKLGIASVMMLLMSFSPDSCVYVCDSSSSVVYHALENCKGVFNFVVNELKTHLVVSLTVLLHFEAFVHWH